MNPNGVQPGGASGLLASVSADRVPALDDPRAIRAVQEYLAALEAGRRPDRQEFLARHPDLADQLSGCLDALEFVHSAAESLHPPAAPSGPHTDLSPMTALGDFRLVREVGRGGMGIVYEAEQVSLDRRVALKVLPYAATMDPKQLQRFRNEAKAAASLHHQNIVPVYAVGCERGVHYYAMQFIDGQSLAEVVRGLRRQGDAGAVGDATCDYGPGRAAPTPPVAALSTEGDPPRGREFYRNVARMIAHAADAVEHAHTMGIVHRDIKPGNLLLDSAGKVWVADFGLARFGPDAGLTMTGDLLGTLRYMAPEQALTKHGLVDHRADVYGLGATLYELLTLRPAMDGEDRREVLRQIAFEDPAPPRRVERSVPAELETITLKALAKDPSERYASAGELATDLCRYLEDRPILARRPTARQRLARWARRHRPVVVTAAAALALLIVAAVIGLAVNNAMLTWERNQTLRERNQTLSAEREGRHRLEQSLVAQAQAHRWTGQLGARAEGLLALEQAARLAAGLDLGDPEQLRLRNEAVGLMALPDFHVVHGWDGFLPGNRQFAIDADFRRYARSDERNVVSVRQVEGDRELFTLESPKEVRTGIGQLKFSPCGRFLARRADVIVWDLERRAAVVTVTGSFDFAFRPDGGAIAISHRDGTVRIHELPGGTELGRFTAPNFARREPLVSFNNSGTVLAVHDYPAAEVQLWNPDTRALVETIAAPGKVMALAWHPDGHRFTIGCSGRHGEIYHYDLDAARWSGPWLGHQSACVEFAFDPTGGLLASKGWDSTTRLWAVEDGRQLMCLPERADATFARDGRLAIRHGKRVNIIETGDRATYRRLSFPGLGITSAAFDPRDRFLVVGAETGLAGWDLEAGRELPAVPGKRIGSVFFDPASGDLITAGEAGLQRRLIEAANVPASQARFGRPVRIGPGEWAPHEAVVSRDGKTLVTREGTSSGSVIDRDAQKLRAPLLGPVNMKFLAVSPDGRWVSAGNQYGEEVPVWDAQTGKRAHSIQTPKGVASRVAFSPDGCGLLVGILGEYSMLDVDSWRVLWSVAGDSAGDVHAELGLIAFTSDSTIAAVRNSRSVIRLLDVATGRQLTDLTAPDLGLLNNLCFDSSGRRLAAVMEDGTVHLWDLPRVRERLAALGLDWAPPNDAGH